MVKIRLRRIGKKKQPIYKIVAADSRSPRNGKFLEALGSYNPRTNPTQFEVKEENLFRWLKRGAQPTDTVRSLLQRHGLWLKWGLMKRGADEATIASAIEKWQMMQTEKQQREAETRARRKAARKAKAAPAESIPAEEAAKPAETSA